ncbi:MAG: hypothetical protein MJ222_01985 [Bacilli bacterium]|nr:hypothetical protein [Bacilli bacterium]
MEQVYKIYNDGSHYIGTKFFRLPETKMDEEDGGLYYCDKKPLEKNENVSFKEFRSENIVKHKEEQSFNINNELSKEFKKVLRKYLVRFSNIDDLERFTIKTAFKSLKEKSKKHSEFILKPFEVNKEDLHAIFVTSISEDLKTIIKNNVTYLLRNGNENEEIYNFLFEKYISLFSEIFSNNFEKYKFIISNYLKFHIGNFSYVEKKNLSSRVKRFRIKAYSNRWNYFVTFTYDDEKMDEKTFKTKLKKRLSNLHNRKGWKYMGVFEKSPKDRLHFHALLYIPSGSMIGEICSISDYSTKNHRKQVRFENTDFRNKFGINDFKPLNPFEIKRTDILNYITKYIGKSNERIFYSRSIPTFLYVKFNDENQCVVTRIIEDMIIHYVLFDDCLITSIPINMKRNC